MKILVLKFIIVALAVLALWALFGLIAVFIINGRMGTVRPLWWRTLIGGPVLWLLEFSAWRDRARHQRAKAARARDREFSSGL